MEIFTTSLPPAVCAAANKSIELLSNKNEWRTKFHNNVKLLRTKLMDYGVGFNDNDSHITTISIGDEAKCKQVTDKLLREFGLYLQPVNYPTVKKGAACLRITVTLKHNEVEMIYLAESLKKILNRMSCPKRLAYSITNVKEKKL